MKLKERHLRITRLSKEIMAECVNTSYLAQEYRKKYLLKNNEVAVDFLNVLDCIHYRLQKEI